MKKKDIKSKQPITINYENKKLPIIYFLPLLLIAGFVPLIVYAKYVNLEGTKQALYWTGQRQYLDFFSYWKAQWVIVLTTIALIFYIVLLLQKKLPFKNLKQYYIPLGIYAVFVIISTIFAIDTQTALWGFVDMYQGMFVLISYVLITFLTINFVNSERDVTLFVKAFLFLMIVEGLLGITQYFGFDFFQTKIGKSLIIPGNLKVENLSFSFGPKTIYGTLFNTNFVGSFATLMLPLAIAFLLGAKTKRQRIVSAIAVVLMIFTWIGCNSRAGYVGIVVSAIFTILLLRNLVPKKKKFFAIIISIMLLIFIILNFVTGGALINRISSLSISKQLEKIKYIAGNSAKFQNISIGKDNFSIKTNWETLNFTIREEKLFFLDENFKELEININNDIITFKEPTYKPYRIIISKNYPGVTVQRATYWDWMTINFYFSNNGVKVLSSGGRLAEPTQAEFFRLFEGYENFASGRGYIWGTTIPMLKQHFVKGAGADNYPMSFPQDDFVRKLNSAMDASTVVDKPHNMFLQTAVNTGLISLLSLLILWVIYIVNSLKLYSDLKYDSFEKYFGAMCCVSVIGYLVTGVFNDSIVSVAPIFWVILGLGISLNFKLSKANKK